jgi:hypothetical protein
MNEVTARHLLYSKLHVNDLLFKFRGDGLLVRQVIDDAANGTVHFKSMFEVIALDFHLFNLEEIPELTRYEAFSNLTCELIRTYRHLDVEFMMDHAKVFKIAGHRALIDQLTALLSLQPAKKTRETLPTFKLIERVLAALEPFFKGNGGGASVSVGLECVGGAMQTFFRNWLQNGSTYTDMWSESAIKAMHLLIKTNHVAVSRALDRMGGWPIVCRFQIDKYQLQIAEAMLEMHPEIANNQDNLFITVDNYSYPLFRLILSKGASATKGRGWVTLSKEHRKMSPLDYTSQKLAGAHHFVSPRIRTERQYNLLLVSRLLRKVLIMMPLMLGQGCDRSKSKLRLLPTDLMRKLSMFFSYL